MRPVPLAPLAPLVLVTLALAACPPPAIDRPEDAGPDAPAPCSPGDARDAALTAGEALEHCGARVTARADGVYTLTVVEAPQPLPFGLEAAGLAFAFDADTGTLAELTVPAARDGRIVRFLRHDGGGWTELEPCVVDEDRVGQEAAPGFVYAALREDRVYPSAKEGLGEGTITRTLDGVVTAFDVDDDLGSAFFDVDADGTRALNLFASAPIAGDPDGHIDTVRIVLTIDADGAAQILEITTGSTGSVDGFYVWLLPVDGVGATATLTPRADDRVVGAVDAVVRLGDTTAQLHADLDVAAERFRFPPEAFCGFPEG